EQGDPVRQTGELQVQVAPPGTVQALQIDGQVYGLDAAGMARARGVPPGEHLLSLAWAGSTAFSPPVTVNIAPSTTFSLRIDASDFS
ncbi:MAG TPA: hypothetical protein VD902_02455, partial [Symbiobacteriaceae bacterium]|nr:hypothetical protein [Symbiobacteriaceae bacterium]